MSKHVPINPEWFEPGADGNSPFEREMRPEWLARDTPKAISAAFRALLAEDAERMEFATGDTVRLEDFPTNRYREHVGKHCLFKFHQGQDLAAVVIDGKIWSWELKHLTLVRKAAPVTEVQPEPLVHVDLSSQPDVTRAVQLDEHGNVLQEVTIEQLAQLGIVTKPTPPALQVGDIVRLERYERGEGVPWINCIDEPYIGKEYAIARFAKSGNLLVGDTVWPASACTLIRRLQSELHARNDESMELRAEVERLKRERDFCSTLCDRTIDHHEKLSTSATAKIAELEATVERLQGELLQCNRINASMTGVSKYEIDRANNILNEVNSLIAERDALQAEVERLTKELEAAKEWPDHATQMRYNRDMYLAVLELIRETYPDTKDGELCDAWRRLQADLAKADAKAKELQARIDCGVRVWGDYLAWGQLEEHDTHTGIVIDVEKIRPDVVEMADERTGKADRRENVQIVGGAVNRKDGTRGGRLITKGPETVEHARSNDRRRVPGTRADRRPA